MLKKVENLIQPFLFLKNLEDDWDGEGSKPISKETWNKMILLLEEIYSNDYISKELENFSLSIFPGFSDEIHLSFNKKLDKDTKLNLVIWITNHETIVFNFHKSNKGKIITKWDLGSNNYSIDGFIEGLKLSINDLKELKSCILCGKEKDIMEKGYEICDPCFIEFEKNNEKNDIKNNKNDNYYHEYNKKYYLFFSEKMNNKFKDKGLDLQFI